MAADGSIIIDTRIDTRGFKDGTTNMKTQFGKLSGIIGKLGAAIGAAFAVRSLINFGKEALELGSDLQEVQNVVDVTFSTMSDRVNEFARNMATAAGLSETMAKRYVGTYGAMSKSFGFAEAEAYEMSTTLTKLTGDVASFYNITQDMAYTKLKSVFTGETESLKDLGVVMTQSALDAYALANGFGKTTSAMTEQEKVALRYRFVLDQLSAASGDFIRTADGWANQTRILKLQFDSLKASIGQGLINLLTPALQMINALLAKLNALAASFKSFTEMLTGKKSSGMDSGYKAAAQSAESLATATSGVAEATKEAAKAAEGYLSPLDEINKMSAPEAPSSSSTGGGGMGVGGGMPVDYSSLEEGETIIDKTSESLNKLITMFKPLKEAWEEYGDSIKRNFTSIGSTIKLFGKEFATSTADWFSHLNWMPLFESFSNFLASVSPLLDMLGGYISEFYNNIILPILTKVIEEYLPWLLNKVSDFFNFLSENRWIIETVGAVLIGAFSAGKIVPLITKIVSSIKGVISIFTGGGGLLKVIGSLVSALGGPLTIAITAAIALIVLMIKNWDDIKNAMTKFKDWISDAFSKDWTKSFGAFGNVINAFFTNVKNYWDGIKTIFSGIITFVKGVFSGSWKQAWEGVKQIFKGIWDSMTGFVRTPVNMIIGMINTMIEAVVGGINSAIEALNGLSVRVPSWVPYYGGRTFGFDLGYIHAPKIPYLATGAVIPPNAPFMAMLGDQRHGNNIEAPESLIRRIVREESGGSGKGYTFVGQINRRVLFEEFITEAKLRQKTTGKNPFEFA